MNAPTRDIIAQLRREIMPLQGIDHSLNSPEVNTTLGPIRNSFPNASFPLAAVHEFISMGKDSVAATAGFISSINASLMKSGGSSIWISPCRNIFPSALKAFGIKADRIIFIELQKEKEMAWAMEEALKCKGLSSVICEMQELSFTTSRRFQLAVEQSKVTGFVLRNNPKNIQATACFTRWKINSLPSIAFNDMPGIGLPRWKIELIKVRNGLPGSWELEYAAGKLRKTSSLKAIGWRQHKHAV